MKANTLHHIYNDVTINCLLSLVYLLRLFAFFTILPCMLQPIAIANKAADMQSVNSYLTKIM